MDNSSSFACRAWSLSSQQRLRNSSISWQSFVRLSWKSLFLNFNSPHKLILSLRALSHIFAWRSCTLWVSSSRWDSCRAISELLCFHLLISTSASISDNFSELHSPLELMTQPSSPEFYEDFLDLSWIDRHFHLDLFCLSSAVHLLWTQILTPAPRAPPIEKANLSQKHSLAVVSQSWGLHKNQTPSVPCQLLTCGCCFWIFHAGPALKHSVMHFLGNRPPGRRSWWNPWDVTFWNGRNQAESCQRNQA